MIIPQVVPGAHPPAYGSPPEPEGKFQPLREQKRSLPPGRHHRTQEPVSRRLPYWLTFTCHGARIGIQTNSLEVLRSLPDRLPPGWRLTSAPIDAWYSLISTGKRRQYLLRIGTRCLARAENLEELLDELESRLHFKVALCARHRLFVHAGVVGMQGRTLVLPGRSLSGKTTLVEALVRAGATYFSDEYAVIDPRGYVHPYLKPLSVREAGREKPRRLPVEQLASPVGTEPWPLGLLVMTQYRAGARWNPRHLSPGESMLALLANTVQARRRAGFALEVLGVAVRGVPALSGTRGKVEATANSLLEYMSRTGPSITQKGALSAV